MAIGDHWGGPDQSAWFQAAAMVPETMQARLGPTCAVVLRLNLGSGSGDAFGWPEGLLYVNGRLQQGINRHHSDALLCEADVRVGTLRFDVRAWSGLRHPDHRIEMAELALLHREVEAHYHLLQAGTELIARLQESDPVTLPLAAALDDAFDQVDLHDPASPALEESAAQALGCLRARLAELRADFNVPGRPVVTAIGHGHLDVAWLWQTRHTREKTARTFGVATALMEHYPEYHFLHTSPQVFAWLERDYPDLFARVCERIAEGRFEAAGAMWLESDCNLVGGESLVRQVLYGQRYMRERFGRTYDALWLPDTFGFSPPLPQIMLRAGLTTFLTTKMSWSETNRVPVDTFRWRGLDGSEVLAHFITTPAGNNDPAVHGADTYNGAPDVFGVRGLWNRYRQKAINADLLLAFGHGDGGAGPTRQHLEMIRAMRELPGLPELRLGRADEYFHRLRERVWQARRLPVWEGELYLEYHRGTYTTQARLKRAHRHNEARLLIAETLDAWQHRLSGELAPDRRATLDSAWHTLLLHKFHDILPGSSIGPVCADAQAAMGGLAETLDGQIREALTAIAEHIAPSGQGPLIFNPSPWACDALVSLPTLASDRYLSMRGQPLAAQLDRLHGDGELLLVEVPAVPGRGFAALHRGEGEGAVAPTHPARAEGRTLENAFFRLEFAPTGEIASLIDKRVPGGRELVAPGATLNRLDAFDDRPRHFDAWDIHASFERKRYLVTTTRVELVETGPLRATMRVSREVVGSAIEQDISLYRTLPRIDFATHIRWRSRHVLLKATFPLDLSTTHATPETAYGAVERPKHRNTSWDQARFETPAHRWVDLSEPGYGVSLLNDGRYGQDIRDHVLRLTLLRSPTDPDPHADQGEHEVTYSLLPHLGDWRAGGTVAEAYALNCSALVLAAPAARFPLRSELDAGQTDTIPAMIAAEPVNAVVETVKRAVDGEGLIVRVYEAHGVRCRASVRCGFSLVSVVECDLLERPLTPDGSPAHSEWVHSRGASHDTPEMQAHGWTFDLRPFEVRTFRLR
ncbi:MAG TPA: alpha-mannosidase [Ktedonobacterales bacterium]|nr:alpha-mannosidase [Ktedonobacterales bacterium]